MWDGTELTHPNRRRRMKVPNSEVYIKNEDRNYLDLDGGIGKKTGRKTPTLCCILDELKPLFGLPKVGTHNYGKYIIQRCRLSPRGNPIEELFINQQVLKQLTHSQKEQVKMTMIFRDIVGIRTKMSDLCIRYPEGYVLSYHERSLDDNYRCNKKYSDLSECVTKMVGIKDPTDLEHVNLVLQQLRSKIDEIVNRIDKDYIGLSGRVCQRIRHMLTPLA